MCHEGKKKNQWEAEAGVIVGLPATPGPVRRQARPNSPSQEKRSPVLRGSARGDLHRVRGENHVPRPKPRRKAESQKKARKPEEGQKQSLKKARRPEEGQKASLKKARKPEKVLTERSHVKPGKSAGGVR